MHSVTKDCSKYVTENDGTESLEKVKYRGEKEKEEYRKISF